MSGDLQVQLAQLGRFPAMTPAVPCWTACRGAPKAPIIQHQPQGFHPKRHDSWLVVRRDWPKMTSMAPRRKGRPAIAVSRRELTATTGPGTALSTEFLSVTGLCQRYPRIASRNVNLEPNHGKGHEGSFHFVIKPHLAAEVAVLPFINPQSRL